MTWPNFLFIYFSNIFDDWIMGIIFYWILDTHTNTRTRQHKSRTWKTIRLWRKWCFRIYQTWKCFLVSKDFQISHILCYQEMSPPQCINTEIPPTPPPLNQEGSKRNNIRTWKKKSSDPYVRPIITFNIIMKRILSSCCQTYNPYTVYCKCTLHTHTDTYSNPCIRCRTHTHTNRNTSKHIATLFINVFHTKEQTTKILNEIINNTLENHAHTAKLYKKKGPLYKRTAGFYITFLWRYQGWIAQSIYGNGQKTMKSYFGLPDVVRIPVH